MRDLVSCFWLLSLSICIYVENYSLKTEYTCPSTPLRTSIRGSFFALFVAFVVKKGLTGLPFCLNVLVSAFLVRQVHPPRYAPHPCVSTPLRSSIRGQALWLFRKFRFLRALCASAVNCFSSFVTIRFSVTFEPDFINEIRRSDQPRMR